jgi:hypothetical protein
VKTIASAIALVATLAVSQFISWQEQTPTAKAHNIAKTMRR